MMPITTVEPIADGPRACEFHHCRVEGALARKRVTFNDDPTESLNLCDDCAESILNDMREDHGIIVFEGGTA
jgi:hypothetical protein